MSRPKIRTALVGILIAISLLFGGFAWYAVNRLQVVNGYVSDLATHSMPSLALAKHMSDDMTNLRTVSRDHILSADYAGWERAEDKMKELSASFIAQPGRQQKPQI